MFTVMKKQRSNTYRLWKAAALVLAIAAVSGCALMRTATYYGDMYRAHRAGVRFRRTYEHLQADVPFSSHSDVTLDVYGQSDGTGYPVLIFVHGGGWNSYDKELFTPVAMQLLPQKMVVVIPGYTLYPDATYQQMAREVADATAWVLRNIEAYGGDPERVYLSGHSAGAHLSGLVSYDPTWLADTGHSTDEIRGWIGLSGVYDTARHAARRQSLGLQSPIMTAVMQGPEGYAAASPEIHAVLGAGPPAWLIHGDEDDTVPLAESERMSSTLRRAGVPAELIVYPGAGHSDFLFGALRDDEARVIVDIGRIVRE
jgi:acetyl esterase/lipase